MTGLLEQIKESSSMQKASLLLLVVMIIGLLIIVTLFFKTIKVTDLDSSDVCTQFIPKDCDLVSSKIEQYSWVYDLYATSDAPPQGYIAAKCGVVCNHTREVRSYVIKRTEVTVQI